MLPTASLTKSELPPTTIKQGTFTPIKRYQQCRNGATRPALKGIGVMDKKSLSERDICSKYIAPAVQQAGWDMHKQVREEVSFTKGRIIVRGKLHSRGEARRADFILYHQANLPIAVIEAKDIAQSNISRYSSWYSKEIYKPILIN
jgi:hypothetical protein